MVPASYKLGLLAAQQDRLVMITPDDDGVFLLYSDSLSPDNIAYWQTLSDHERVAHTIAWHQLRLVERP